MIIKLREVKKKQSSHGLEFWICPREEQYSLGVPHDTIHFTLQNTIFLNQVNGSKATFRI